MRWLTIEHTWDGQSARPGERARVGLALDGEDLLLRVQAPDHRDPGPSGTPGHTPGLWEHEVVELFLCGPDDRYLELELCPRGHHLVLLLDGVRNAIDSPADLDVTFELSDGSWTAQARLPAAWLPTRPWRANAYAIHGVGAARRYLACHPVPGDAPDFHRIHLFPTLVLEDS